MDLFEDQAKDLFAKHGVPCPAGEVATTVEDAVAAAERLGTPVMVKAQVKAGGRGKAGGVKFCSTLEDVRAKAGDILGLDIKGLWLVDFDNGSGYYCWKHPEVSLDYYHTYVVGFGGRVRIQ